MDTIIIAAVFVIYLGVMVVIGMKYYNKEDDMSEYILGGRKLPPIERMASDGTSGTGLHTLRRHIGSYLDCRWTGIGNISQLALRRQEAEKVYSGGGERHYAA